MDPYVLRAEGQHESDVKWAQAFPANKETPATLVTASRDRTAASWILPSPGAGESGESTLTRALTFAGHTHYVNFVLFLDNVPCAGGVPMIATGSHDKNVLLFNVSTSALDGVLCGHDDVVKAGATASATQLVTASWDNSCIVWDLSTGELQRRVRPHTNNIACVTKFVDDEMLSCGGDKSVARWRVSTGEILARYGVHDDTVQAVVSLVGSTLFQSSFGADRLFASAGNDSQILVWNADAPKAPLARFIGHESIIYSLSCNPHTGELLSTGDDNTLRVWGPTACNQCVFHPALVWSSCCFPEDDTIATACSDGTVRVWTRNVLEMANAGQIERLESAVASTKLSAKLALHGIDPLALPSKGEATKEPGAFEGQRTLARTGDFVEAFAWGQGRWDKIGLVVASGDDDGSGVTKKRAREKQFYNGQYYDYVFDVEIAGVPLKLTYNRGQSVFDAAQQFIYDYAELGVSQMDKEMIQSHILDAIEPEDAALVGGGVARGGAASSSANYAFSAYAKELAEMEAQGMADGKGSYRDEYKRMQDRGEVPNFSTFAQEEAEAAAAAGGKPVAAPAASSSDVALQSLTEQALADVSLFTGFKAEGAVKKLAEFGVPESDTSSIAERIAASESLTADTAAQLIGIARQLQPGQTFPVIDMLRAGLCHTIDTLTVLEPVADDMAHLVAAALQSTATEDAERLVALRCVANVFATAAATANLTVANAFLQDPALNALAACMRRATSRQASAPLKAAALRVMSAMAMTLSRICDSGTSANVSAGGSLVSYIALGLIIELDNSNVKQLVRACVVLLCGPLGSRASHPLRQRARETAAKEIFGIVRAKKEYGDPDIVAACKLIYQILSPLVPP
jgi:phospholipase A-2-activating protein